MKRLHRTVAAAVLGCSLAAAVHASPIYYAPRDLGGDTVAYDINSTGQVVGDMMVNGKSHAFRWSNGTLTDLSTLERTNPAGQSGALAINDSGQIAGWSTISGATHAVKWDAGLRAYDLHGGLPTGTASYATDINSLGTIVGYAYSDTLGYRPVSYDEPRGHEMLRIGGGIYGQVLGVNADGTITGWTQITSGAEHGYCVDTRVTDLATPTSALSAALAVNANDVMVGYWEAPPAGEGAPPTGFAGQPPLTAGIRHAAMWTASGRTDLAAPGTVYSVATDISDLGLIVGYIGLADGNTHAALWRNGVMEDLDPYGGMSWLRLEHAYGVNAAGQIVGDGIRADGSHGSFVLSVTTTPPEGRAVAPEPASLALLALGGSLVLRRRGR